MSELPSNTTDLNPDAIIELYQIDTSRTHYRNGQKVSDGQTFYFTPGTIGDEKVKFGGTEYIPCPIQGKDYQWNGQGTVAQPKLNIMNIGGIVSGLTIALDDLIGAEVTRIRTFVKHLDGQSEANPNIHWEPDVFIINRKSIHDKNQIEFELRTPFEALNVKVPRSLIMRNTCMRTYRQWINGAWVYGTCPYTGDAMYDGDNKPTNSTGSDICSKRLSSCILRFGEKANIPAKNLFPGAGITGG